MLSNSGQAVSKKAFRVGQFLFDPAEPDRLIEVPPKAQKIAAREDQLLVVAERLGLVRRGDVPGSFHWLPAGVTVRSLILEVTDGFMSDYGAQRFELSRLFLDPKEHEPGSELVRRFRPEILAAGAATDGRQLLYASDPTIFSLYSGRSVPVPLRTYSPGLFYRNEASGNLKPLTRPREFFMTDFHTFGAPELLDEFRIGAALNARAMQCWMEKPDWSLSVDTNVTFWRSRQDEVLDILRTLSVPATINLTENRTHYYDLQFGFLVDYFCGNITQVGNLQFDTVNGERFNIRDRATGKWVSITHGTLSSRPERVLALLLGRSIEREPSCPALPVWLSPVMVRILPLDRSTAVNELVDQLRASLRAIGVRLQVDRNAYDLRKRIKAAEQAWVPYIVIVGPREAADRTVQVRTRRTGERRSAAVAELAGEIARLLAGRPRRPLNGPEELELI